MATVSQVLGFVQSGSANVDGYTVLPAGQSGVDNAFVKLVFGDLVEYYCFSEAVLKVLALSDAVEPSDNTNINRYSSDASFQLRYSKDAKGVLQYEDDANVAHYIFYIDPSVADTSIQTFTTNSSRYSSSSSFNLTVINTDGTADTYQKTANTNIIKPQGTSISVVYDDLGFLQAATDKVVGTDGVMRDVVPAGELVKYIKSADVTEYYKKGTAAGGSAVPLFKQVNADGSDIAGVITWREYGTAPDSITTYAFATEADYVNGSILVSGGYTALGETTPEAIRTFTRESSGVISETVSGVKHLYAYTNAGYSHAISNAAVGNKINDIRSTTTKPVAASGTVYEVKFTAVHYKDSIYRAFPGYSALDINPELFANQEQYLVNDYFYVMKAEADSADLSQIASASKKIAESLINVQAIVANEPEHTINYTAYKNIGLKNAAAELAISEQVTKGADTYTSDALNVLKIGTTYISYLSAISKHAFATSNGKYSVDDILRQRSVEADDSNTDLVMSKWATDSVNVEGLAHTETYTDAGIKATVHREGDARSTLKVLSASDDSVLRTLTREATDLPAEVIESVKHYYAITNAAYLFAINNAAVGNMINDIRGGQLTTDLSVNMYLVKFSRVTKLSNVYYAFDGYSTSDINSELFANDVQYLVDEYLCVMKPVAESADLSLIASASKKIAESLINVHSIASNVPQHTINYTAYKNIGLKNASELLATSEKVTKGAEIFTSDATHVLKIGTTYISYMGAISKEAFATSNSKYNVDDILRQRTVGGDDSNTDVIINKFAASAVEQEGEDSTVVYGDLGLLGAARRESARTTVQNAATGDVFTRHTLNVLKREVGGLMNYLEYNNLSTITLREFASGDYADKSMLLKMNTSTGALAHSYQRVISSVIYDEKMPASENLYYEFNFQNSKPVQESAKAELSDVPIGAIIIDMNEVDDNEPANLSGAAYFRKYAKDLVRRRNAVDWYAYSLAAFGSAAKSSDLVNGHNILFIQSMESYIFIAEKVLRLSGTTEFLMFDNVVSEKQYAEGAQYFDEGRMLVRSSEAGSNDSDIIYTKLAANVVNSSDDSSSTHVYSDLGLLNAAKLSAEHILSGKIADKNSSDIYTYVAQYLLKKDGVEEVFEYNSLQTLTLKEYTTNNVTYPVLSILHHRNIATGAKVNDYTKVMASVAKIDFPNNTYYVFSVAAREAAVDNTNTIVSSNPISTIYQDLNGAVTTYYKTSISTAERVGGTPDYEVGTYHALGQLATGASDPNFVDGKTVLFTDIGKTYIRISQGVLREVGTQHFIGYDGALTQQEFATGSYTTGATLAQRSTSVTSPDDAVPASDVLLLRIADNIVNKAIHSLSPVYEATSYAYAELGLRNAAVTADAKSTIVDVPNAHTYTKFAAYLLGKGGDLFEYNSLSTFSIKQLVSGENDATYSFTFGNKLHKMNIATGAEVATFRYIRQNVALAENDNEYYGYASTVYRAVSTDDSIVIGSKLITTAGNNKPSELDYADTLYYKRATALLQKGTSNAFIAVDLSGFKSAVTGILGSGDNVKLEEGADGSWGYLKANTTWYYDAANLVKTESTDLGATIHTFYMSFADAASSLSEETFATSSKYQSSSLDYAGDVLVRRTATSSDSIFTKLFVNAILPHGGIVHAYGDLGMLRAAVNVTYSYPFSLKNVSTDKEYVAEKSAILREVASGDYFEYNSLATLTLQEFTSETGVEGRSYSVGRKLYKRSTINGSAVNTYTKVMTYLSQIDTPANTFYAFRVADRQTAVNEEGLIVPVSSTIYETVAAVTTVYSKTSVGGAYSDSAATDFEVLSYAALATLVTSNASFTAGKTVHVIVAADSFEKTYVADSANLIYEVGTDDYITFDQAVSRKAFATNNSKYLAGATLAQRSSSAASPAADVIYTKVDSNCVDSNGDSSSLAYEDLGLLGAARSSTKSSVKHVVADNAAVDETNTLYEIVKQNLLKLSNANEYSEYSELVGVTLRKFSSNVEGTYATGSTLKKMSKTTGSLLNTFTKTVDQIVYDTTAAAYYSFNGYVYAGEQADATIAIDSLIYDVKGNNEPVVTDIAYIKRYLCLLRRQGTAQWHASSYLALAYASKSDSQFVSGHSIKMENFVATYNYKAPSVVQDNSNLNHYITFDAALTEEAYATDNGSNYALGQLIHRLSTAIDASADITITKLATNLVNTTADIKTHAYDNLGLRNVAYSNGIGIKEFVIDIKNGNKEYILATQHVLQETVAGHFYEYNELKTLTLKTFTTQAVSGSRSYPVGRKLFGRDKTTGEAVVVYQKVIAEISKKDELNSFWVYSVTARDVAVNEDGSIIPGAASGANRSAIHYIDESNVETVYYKSRVGGVIDQNAQPGPVTDPDHIAQSYEALATLVTGSTDIFKIDETVEFKINGTSVFYNRIAANVVKQVGTNSYIAYNNAITRIMFANGSYPTNATLIQRDASKTVEAEVIASDITITKLGDSAVNRRVGATEDSVTYAYEAAGLKTAARSAASKSTVRKVTSIDVSSDSSYTDYSKVSANILQLGNTYYEYANFSSLSISTFATSASYAAGDELHKMSIDNGEEETSSYMTPYIKKMANVVQDSTTDYYIYGGDEAPAARAADAIIAIGKELIKTSQSNEPSGAEYRNASFMKKAIALLQVGSSGEHKAYAHIGLRSAAVSILTVTQTVSYLGTTWTYSAANELVTGTSGTATYLTFADSTPHTTEADYARTSKYTAVDTLLHRTLSDNSSVDATNSDISITKLAPKVVNVSNDSTYTHSYDVDGLKNAALLADSTAIKSKIIDISLDRIYDRVSQYLLKNEASTDFYEFNGLDTLNIRTVATSVSYSAGNKLHKMSPASGAEENSFTKKYADIALDTNNGEYYCYNEASLASVANEYVDVIAVGSFVWEMAVGSTEEPALPADLKWTKTERFVLRAEHLSSKKKYNIYSIAIGAGIPLNEFACDATYAAGDRLIRKVSPNDAYDRITTSVLHKDGDAGNKFSTYYYGSVVLSHLELKGASLASDEMIPVGSTLVKMDGTEWVKRSTGILNKDTAFIAFAGSLGPETLATNDTLYAIGSTLRLVADNDAESVNYVKNLSGVIYQYQSDEYECYGANGLVNAAQAENLVENRDAANPYVLRPQLSKIELFAPIKDMANGGAYYFKYRQNVLVDVTKSGASFSVTAPAHFYDYNASSAFGSLSLQELATTASFSVDVELTDALHSSGTWTKKAADVILKGTTYYSYSDAAPGWSASAGNKWLAYSGVIGHTVEEKGAVGSLVYTIMEAGVLRKDDASTYYTFNGTDDTLGLTLNTFATQGSIYTGATLVDRTSVRAGPSYVRTDAGLLRDDASNYVAFTEAGLATAAAKTLTTSTTVTEDATGTWSMAGRKVYTWYRANVLSIASESAYYVYSLAALSLNEFATVTYAKNDTLVDRTSLYNGARYSKVLAEHGVLERKENLAAAADAELLTYDGNGVLGLRNASLATEIADGKVLAPEISELKKHLRSAKGLLREYNTAGTAMDSKFKVFQEGSEEPVAALRLAAKNLDAAGNALTGDRAVAAESQLYVTASGAATYNYVTLSYVKDGEAFVDTLRVGGDAVSDKITYANMDGTHYNVLRHMCEEDESKSIDSAAGTAKYLNKQLIDRSVSPVVTYYVLSRGVLRERNTDANGGATGNDSVFSQNGLVAAATFSDSMQTFSLYSFNGVEESSDLFTRVKTGLLVSDSVLSGVASPSQEAAAILYYSDYSASAKDDLKNMSFYLYSLAKQGSVGGSTTSTDLVLTNIASGTITKLYTIVTKIGGAAAAQQFEAVDGVSNIVRVSSIDGTSFSPYYLAYNASGAAYAGIGNYSVVAEALARDGLAAAANSDAVPTNSVLYASSSYVVNANAPNFQFKKNGAGSMDGPGPANNAAANGTGSVFTYSAEGLRTFAKLNRAISTSIPKGARGSNATANVYTVWDSKTYYAWEQSIVLAVVGGVQHYEVYDGAENNFARRVALAETNFNAVDKADTQGASPAYVAGSKVILCGSNVNTSGEVKTYSKVATGLIKLDANSQHYAFSTYGLAAGANLASLPANMIEMGASEEMSAVESPVWTVKMSQLLKNGAAWRTYNASGATVAATKEYFAKNSSLDDVMTVFSYAAPDTTAAQRTYTNVLNGSTTAVVQVSSAPAGEIEYQTYGHIGLALIANSDLAAFAGANLKVREIEMYAITGDSNSANTGKYKKLQQGAMYKSGAITLYDDFKYQEVIDRFDITEFSSIDTSNAAAIKNDSQSAYLSLTPQYYMPAPPKDETNTVLAGFAYTKVGTPATVTLSGINYKEYPYLEREFLGVQGTPLSETVLTNTGNFTALVNPFTVKHKNGAVEVYANHTYRYRVRM